MLSIEIPFCCPSCGGEVGWSNDLLFCLGTECPAKSAKRMEHFVQSLKIKGLGPRTLEKLQVSNFPDLFMLDREDIVKQLGSAKIAEKIYSEILNAEQAPANILLPAFGIPLIGKTASEKLSIVCDSIFDIDKDSCSEAGLGPKATQNLLTWLETEFYTICNEMPFSYEFKRSKNKNNRGKGVICISGKLKSFSTKAEATKALEDAGYTVKSSLTKDVTILVNESGIASSKTKQAESNNVTIVTNLLTLIGD